MIFSAGNCSDIEAKHMDEEGRVHPDCRNASNPYHECSEYCFKIIAEAKKQMNKNKPGVMQASISEVEPNSSATSDQGEVPHDEIHDLEDHPSPNGDDNNDGEDKVEGDSTSLTGRQKKLFELRLKMNEARKANQTAMVAEKKRMEAPSESRGISKEKWLEERKKKIGKLLDSNGLDMTKAYMLDTQDVAETKYKKWEKEPAPVGWDGLLDENGSSCEGSLTYSLFGLGRLQNLPTGVPWLGGLLSVVFNQKTLYNAYKKRTKNIEVDLEDYNKLKEADSEFYREASSLQYGKAPKISEEKIDKMVKELKDRDEKRKSFSRRRRFHEEKDIDSINDRNEHFNKKIERAFGRYTLEIKNNLERGTALPD
ncbi:unnamed protein product [Ilex paraguariensis]|uniref:Pre-mRNA-splicing factor SYF2 n=1 Tax=Ilex paraguariensis TaxID=185542 RepID=A0ABC8TE13_9AQUA